MDKFTVKLYSNAANDLDEIYAYIAISIKEPELAGKLIDELEEAFFFFLSLEYFPERGSFRQVGAYAGKKYRQLFVKNYVIIYKVLKNKKEVHIVTIRYTASNF